MERNAQLNLIGQKNGPVTSAHVPQNPQGQTVFGFGPSGTNVQQNVEVENKSEWSVLNLQQPEMESHVHLFVWKPKNVTWTHVQLIANGSGQIGPSALLLVEWANRKDQ